MRSPIVLTALLICRQFTAADATTNDLPYRSRRSSSILFKHVFVSTVARKKLHHTTHPFLHIPRGGESDGFPSSSKSGKSSSKKSSSSSSSSLSSSLSDSLFSGLNMPDNISDLLNNQSPPGPEQIQQTIEQFANLLTSPQVQEMMANPAKMTETLETMRTSIMAALNEMENGDNVMVKMMLNQMKEQVGQSFPGGWEGLKQLIEDPEQWREMTSALVEAMRNLGEDDIKNIMAQMAAMGGAGMMGGGGIGGGMPGGIGGMGMGGATLGDTYDDAGTLAGLDDLSEDD